MRIENALKAKLAPLVDAFMPPPEWVRFAHQDGHTTGVPDWSLTGKLKTGWWEFKHLDRVTLLYPAKTAAALGVGSRQHLNMRRLEVVAHCAFYVVWLEGPEQTRIVRPRALESLHAEASTAGYDMEFVTRFMREAYR